MVTNLKKQILFAARHQFIEGDVLHWWHSETKKGVRTRFSDDYLWLVYAVLEYIKVANSDDILFEEVEYLNGEKLLENEEEKLIGYKKAATARIILVGNTMIFAIAAFYLMGAYQSMLWVAAVSAIGWYFTKPSARKMELELQPKDPNVENY